jgi:SAM-dependent methyltransferase
VLVAQLVHHFNAEQNRELAKRIARALRPNGVFVILDAFRPQTPGERASSARCSSSTSR